jgi:hypothetical protein
LIAHWRDLLSRRYYSLSHRQFSLSHRRHSFSQAPHLVSHKRRLLPTNGIRGYCRQPRRWLLFGIVFKIESVRKEAAPLIGQQQGWITIHPQGSINVNATTCSLEFHSWESHGRMSIRPQGRPFTFYFLPSVTLHSAHSPYNCLLRATFSNYGCH